MQTSDTISFFNAIVGLIFFVFFIRFLYYHRKLIKYIRNNATEFNENVLANSQNYWFFINSNNKEEEVDEQVEYLRIQVRQTSRNALLFFIAFVVFTFLGAN